VTEVIWKKNCIADLSPLADANGFVLILTPCNTLFFGPTRVSPPHSISIVSTTFCTVQLCDQHTDRQTDYVTCDIWPQTTDHTYPLHAGNAA